ncbi:MAG: hypothetical protein A2Y62_15210 [Candidatus Fischerbacteria bacterium RBG_13_37_8]|uniref:Peptidase M16 n=1 Tax=Candidatus Fischerbacteria bacterium RBG_13_37_8 TaxID=1817863 RepID=A0A1F5V7A2_9BACT|nr:MAG: hypothetical protein A2Y62_15210 [Candidatus Fischerbacteria bacterium RBG_13_37_8]
MKKLLFVLLAIFIAVPLVSGTNFSEKTKEFTLDNGLKFFVYERHQIPTFAGMLMVKVGSVDERKGETGMAHFFEHMAFKGTTVIGTRNYEKEKPLLDEMDKIGDKLAGEYLKGTHADINAVQLYREQLVKLQEEALQYVIKDEIDKIYAENGGEFLNAGTGNDTTTYFVMLPSNRLELWFLIESERFKNPVLREFYSERDVIAEERRMYEDNDPEGYLSEEFYNIAFLVHPYRHSVVGYMEDIQSYTKEKAVNFYKTFYTPNNMMAAIIGDVSFDEVKELAEKYFSDMPTGSEPPHPVFIEPVQKGERKVKVKFDAEPSILIGYHMPPYTERDNIVMEAIGIVLAAGNSSRLVRDLVTNKKLAISISANENDPGARYESLFTISGLPRFPNTPEDLEEAVNMHLEKLKTEPVPKKELMKIINQAEASLYRGMTSNIYLGWRILRGALLFNDIDAEFKRVELMKTITPEEIMAVANKIFVESNRTVGILVKKEKEAEQ